MSEYYLIALSILLAAFHSGNETGFYCVNRLRVRLRAERGDPSARAIQDLMARPRLAISTMLMGTNIGVYIATVTATERIRTAGWAGGADFYASLIMPPILLLFADFIPKSLFQHHAEALMYRTVWGLKVSKAVFYPLAALLRWVSGLPHLVLRGGAPETRKAVTAEAFRFYLRQGASQGALSAFQRTAAENIMRLRSVELEAAMRPLEEVVMVAADAPPEQMLDLLREHRYSRIPVYSSSEQRITGVINVIDVAEADATSASPRELARRILSVRRDRSVADTLRTLRDAKQQLAAVTDAEGRALGIVTIKDLVEEIVGELEAW